MVHYIIYDIDKGVDHMAKAEGQKLKMLYLKEYLENFSDENHPLSTQQIIDYLAAHNITAERKSIYNDIECL